MGLGTQGERGFLSRDCYSPALFSTLSRLGVSREDFAKLMQHSEIPVGERKLIVNLMHVGCNILNEVNTCMPKAFPVFRQTRRIVQLWYMYADRVCFCQK